VEKPLTQVPRQPMRRNSSACEKATQATQASKHASVVSVLDKSAQNLQTSEKRNGTPLCDTSVQTDEDGQQESVVREGLRGSNSADTYQAMDSAIQVPNISGSLNAIDNADPVLLVCAKASQVTSVSRTPSATDRASRKGSNSADAYQAMDAATQAPSVSGTLHTTDHANHVLQVCATATQVPSVSRAPSTMDHASPVLQVCAKATHVPTVSRALSAMDQASPVCANSRDRATWEDDDFSQQAAAQQDRVAPSLEASQQDCTEASLDAFLQDADCECGTSLLDLRSGALPPVFPALQLRSVVQSDWSGQSPCTRTLIGTHTLSRPPRQQGRWRHKVATGGVSNRDAETLLRGSWGRPSSRLSCRSSSPLVN